MENINDFLATIPDESHRAFAKAVFDWVKAEFPQLESVIKWNQPMFTDHGTFIIGFSASKNHLAAAPEHACMVRFEAEMDANGVDHTKELMRFPWEQPIDYALLKQMIAFNIADKAGCEGFWRKN